MSRTIEEIYDNLALEKSNNTVLNALQPNIDNTQLLLNQLTTKSNVGIWRLMYFNFAVQIWAFEQLLDIHTTEIEERKLELVTGTDRWYTEQSKLFQLGDSLTWNGVQFQYETIDTDKQIIAFASTKTDGVEVRVKVAKDDGTGLPEKLTTSELNSFAGYIDEIGFSGTNFIVLSTDADPLKIAYNVFYDSLILNPDGSLITDATTFPVEDAINAYIVDLDFSGTFRIAELTDAIQAVNGVANVVATTVEAKVFGGTYSDILATPRQEYVTVAGYMKIDPAFPLSTQISYILK